MEPVSLAVGIIPLFKTCFEIYGAISGLRHAKGDLEEVIFRVGLETKKLRLIEKTYNKGELNGDIELLLQGYLSYVELRMKEIENVISKYSSSGKRNQETPHPRNEGHVPSTNPFRSVKWVATDRDLVNEQLGKLTIYVDYAWQLVSSQAERTRESYRFTNEAISTQDASRLQLVATLPGERYSGSAKAARVKMLLLKYGVVHCTVITKSEYLLT